MPLRRRDRNALLFLALFLAVFAMAGGCSKRDWRTASRESAGIAPLPAATPGAVVQAYAAPTFGWRGWFAVHTWISVKRSGADHYTVYEVIGWRLRHGQPVVRIERDLPDRYWYGERPTLLATHEGAGVDTLIDKVDAAARAYPWPEEYQAFPGPNSNTFIAWIAKEVPELQLDLPFSAIGSGYID